MVLALPVLAALAVGFALGGRLTGLIGLRLRHAWLFFAAIGLQVIAFPFPFLPWSTPDVLARVIWLVSYGALGAAAGINARIPGVLVVSVGMLCNVVAIVSNGGHMPSLPSAVKGAGEYTVQYNSKLDADPNVAWLVDRWAMPGWIPGGNVFSIGDVVIGVGAFLLVVAAMRPFRSARRRDPIVAFLDTLSSDEAAAVASAMRDVARNGPVVAKHVRLGIHELSVDCAERTLVLLFAESGRHRQVLLAVEDGARMDAGARHALALERHTEWVRSQEHAPPALRRDSLAAFIERRLRREGPSFRRLLEAPSPYGRPDRTQGSAPSGQQLDARRAAERLPATTVSPATELASSERFERISSPTLPARRGAPPGSSRRA